MRIYCSIKRKFGFGNLLDILINAYLHSKARRYAHSYPQMAILAYEHIGIRINMFGRYEAEELDIVSAFLATHCSDSNNMTALDIGANIGNHSVYFASLFQDVFAFEPNPVTFHLLQFNATLKDNIICRNLGLSYSDKDGVLIFNKQNIGGGTLNSKYSTNDDTNNVDVKLVKLDNVSEIKDKNIGLIKIDVEGHEINVLKGAAELIRSKKPVILFEQNSDEIHQGSSECIEFLRLNGYKFATFEESNASANNLFGKIIGYGQKLIFGQRISLVEQENFETRSYHMIVAIPQIS